LLALLLLLLRRLAALHEARCKQWFSVIALR